MDKAELIKLIEYERYEFMFGDGEIESAHNYAMNKAVEIINEALEGYLIVPDSYDVMMDRMCRNGVCSPIVWKDHTRCSCGITHSTQLNRDDWDSLIAMLSADKE